MTKLRLKIDAGLSCTGKTKWKDCNVDDEIADIVKALQDGGIDMLGSCSGHGKKLGSILLKDRRILFVCLNDTFKYRIKAIKKVKKTSQVTYNYLKETIMQELGEDLFEQLEDRYE